RHRKNAAPGPGTGPGAVPSAGGDLDAAHQVTWVHGPGQDGTIGPKQAVVPGGEQAGAAARRRRWPDKEMRTMKRVVGDHFGGPEVLRVVEEDDPRPGPGEVRVRVLAAGVSYTDAMLRAGSYLGVPSPPFTPGYELVGVVEE